MHTLADKAASPGCVPMSVIMEMTAAVSLSSEPSAIAGAARRMSVVTSKNCFQSNDTEKRIVYHKNRQSKLDARTLRTIHELTQLLSFSFRLLKKCFLLFFVCDWRKMQISIYQCACVPRLLR